MQGRRREAREHRCRSLGRAPVPFFRRRWGREITHWRPVVAGRSACFRRQTSDGPTEKARREPGDALGRGARRLAGWPAGTPPASLRSPSGRGAASLPAFAGSLDEVAEGGRAGSAPAARRAGRPRLPAAPALPPSLPSPPRRRFRRGSAGQEWHPAAGDSITGMLPSARPRAAEEGDRRLALPRLGPGAERDTAGATAGLEVGLQPRTPSLGKGL